LAGEFDKSYLSELRTFLAKEISAKKIIYPKSSEIFRAFDLTPYDRVRVVVLGQDPYHGPDQAHGLCFSVRRGVAPPPSLKNIYKELQADLGIAPSSHGDLSSWAEQGVLLLNTVLTVEDGKAASHRGKGWEAFTDRVISELSARERPIIFVLWGSFAQSKAPMVRRPPHAVLMAPHPSPLSAHRGFLGSKPFSAINRQLKAWGEPPIDWKLPE
jgi:uracil-DNA glycosylase